MYTWLLLLLLLPLQLTIIGEINGHHGNTSVYCHEQCPAALGYDGNCNSNANGALGRSVQSVTAERLQLNPSFILLESIFVWLGARLLIA
ncbi:hypothetical protein AWZ03_005844 [Drosophila navojoa]|uniref:Uncharacterized protein n=1 Tax=Drosophila navojoa TaxID=7232 RepID=A0A484BI38_DRONA|nr:hypothetical protein AWZ03_005844 [Drosophila navojoa]